MAYNYESLVVKDNYEVSIWEDVYDTQHQRFTEKKIAVIGSNTMTAQTRILDPTLTENINGTKTLTFNIYYRYIDNYDGEEKINPFIKLLLVERKIKLYWKGDWYDFIIKQRVESSDKHSFIYTCESLAANELTKTGYHLEFDTELANNTDTVWNLARTVLEDTDWRIAEDSGKNFRETVTEAGYKISVSPAINSQSYLLVFYNTIFNTQEKDSSSGTVMFQAWVGDLETADNKGVLTSGTCVTDTAAQYTKYIANGRIRFQFSYNNTTYTCNYYDTINDDQVLVYDYRAKRDVLTQLTTYSPPLKRYVGKYTIGSGSSQQEILGYTTAEYVTPEAVTNLIINGETFTNTDGWLNADSFTIYPTYDENTDVTNYHPKGYLLDKKRFLANKCFLNNTAYLPDGLPKGTVLRVKIHMRKASYNSSTGKYTLNPSNSPSSITASVNEYEWSQESQAYTRVGTGYGSKSLNRSIVTIDQSTNEQTAEYVGDLTITNTITRADMLSKDLAFFIDFGGAAATNTAYAIESAEFYLKKLNSDGEIITPNSFAQTSVITYVSKYFALTDNIPTKTEDDIKWLYVGTSQESDVASHWTDATPMYDSTCEKIRTIAGKNSTRYNWLQTLAETFELWCKFWVVHDANGEISYDSNGKPEKYVTFVDRVGTNADYGFVYGIDLRSIQRTIDSSALATKIIVPQNSNEFAKDGYCTIQRSDENYSKENYIINFDYYCDNGLIDRGRFYIDLYGAYNEEAGDLGYYQRLHNLNTTYDANAEQIIALENDLELQQSALSLNTHLRDSANNEINSLKSQIMMLIAEKNSTSLAPYDEQKVKQFMDANPDWEILISLYATLRATQANEVAYNAQVEALTPSIQSIINTLESETQPYGLYKLQEQNREDRKAIVTQFNKRYSRYLQEGTWTSNDYTDDTKYYLDAQAVAYTSARPKLTYNIQVIRLSALEDFKSKEFKLGDISWIEDEEFFIAHYREEVVVTQVVSHLDTPENDTITVQNYRTEFQDLFQRTESTIHSFQYGEGTYNKVSSIINEDGTIKVSTLQNSIEANNFLMNQSGLNNTVTTGPDGITVTDLSNISNRVRITANGVFISRDGGANWINAIKGDGVSTDALTAGIISTRDIVIDGGQGNTFRWDDRGISAYYFDGNNGVINTGHFLRLDRFGVYGVLNNENFAPSSESDIYNNAAFGMTWNKFFMKHQNGNHYVEISSTDDIRVVKISGSSEIEQIKIGELVEPLSSDPDSGVYGIRINDNNGNTVMETNSNGTLWIKHILNIGTTSSGSYIAQIGYLPLVTNNNEQITWLRNDGTTLNLDTRTIGNTSTKIHRNLSINNKFVVWEDGTVYANDGYFAGTINATAGTIGNVSVETVAQLPGQVSDLNTVVNELKTFEITSEAGYTFTVDKNGTVSPSSVTLTAQPYGFTISSGSLVTWSGSTDPTGSWDSYGTGLTKTFNYSGIAEFATVNTYYIKATCSVSGTTYTAYAALNQVKDGLNGQNGSPYIVNVINDTIYRTYGEGATSVDNYVISNSGYEFQLLDQDNNILRPSQDYSVVISMLPIMDVLAPETAQEHLLDEGYSDILSKLSGKVIEYNSILTYDANTRTYNFSLQVLRNLHVISTLPSEELAEITATVDALKNILATNTVSFLVSFYIDRTQQSSGKIVGTQLLFLNTALSSDLATFTDTAKKIQEAQRNASYEFTNTGFVINNGDFTINKDSQLVLGVDPDTNEFTFNGTVYAQNGSFTGNIYANEGYFRGTLEGASGSFSGQVIADRGTIGGFIIQEDRLVSVSNSIQLIGGYPDIWDLYETVTLSSFPSTETTFSVNGTIGDILFNELTFTNNTISANDGSNIVTLYENGAWIKSNYRTLKLSGGADLDNSTLHTWLVNNGTNRQEGTDSKIIAQNIEIGRGASITEYINLGTTARLGGDSESYVLIAGTEGGYANPKILIQKDGIIKLGNENNQIVLNGIDSTIGGGQYGAEWFISPTVASFANIVASGKITTSIFEYNKIQVVGGSMVFRPVFEIISITDINTTNHTLKLVLDTNVTLFIEGENTEDNSGAVLKLYQTSADLSDLENEDLSLGCRVIGTDGTVDGKVCYIVTYDTAGIPTLGYKYAFHFGEVNIDSPTTVSKFSNELLLGVNSTNTGGVLLPKGLTFKNPIAYNDTTQSFTYGTLPRLYLGDLRYLSGLNLESGFEYGLYADNVILNGSLTTRQYTGVQTYYAGINTNTTVMSEKIGNYDKPVIIWSGSIDTVPKNIANAPFQVTQDGSIYASSGTFEGTIITKSIIQASALYTAKIFGDNESTSVPLSIYSTGQGINFYNSYDTSATTDDRLTLSIKGDGLYTYKYTNIDSSLVTEAKQFISINHSTGLATFTGAIIAETLEIGNFIIQDNRIINTKNSNATLEITNNDLAYYLPQSSTNPSTQLYFRVNNASLTEINTEETNILQNLSLGSSNRLHYKKVTDGYDLFIE